MSRVQFPLTFSRNQVTMPKTVISEKPLSKENNVTMETDNPRITEVNKQQQQLTQLSIHIFFHIKTVTCLDLHC